MPAGWSIFRTNLTNYLNNVPDTRTKEDLARKIATEYVNAVKLASITTTTQLVLSTPPSSIIEQGFLTSFTSIEKTGTVSPVMYIPAATSIVTFWTSVLINPLPPPIGYVSPTTGNQILFPGLPTPLNNDIYSALSDSATSVPNGLLIATKLVTGFSNHLKTISGIYNGLIPATPSPIPGPPFPWTGIS